MLQLSSLGIVTEMCMRHFHGSTMMVDLIMLLLSEHVSIAVMCYNYSEHMPIVNDVVSLCSYGWLLSSAIIQ